MKPSLRSSACIAAFASVALPLALYVHQAALLAQRAAEQPGGHCGLPWLAAVMLSVVLATLLSLVSVGLGVAALIRAPAPRPARRFAEVLLLGVPLMLGTGAIALTSLPGLFR